MQRQDNAIASQTYQIVMNKRKMIEETKGIMWTNILKS